MRWKLGLSFALLTAALGGVAVFVWVYRRDATPAPQETHPAPPFTASPYLTTRPDARYVGIEACRECHKGRHESYLHTAHSRALLEPDADTEPPDGQFDHQPSGRSYRVYRDGKQVRHEEILRTTEGKVIGRLDLPVRYRVGAGNFARTYVAQADGFLVESPITYYAQKKSWGMSPGYDRPAHRSFMRVVGVECLVCHTGRVEPTGTTEAVTITEQAIGCERCHGPGSHHVSYHRARKHPAGAEDLSIVNPAKLSRPLAEAICASCHVQTKARADVRGRTLNDFRPGRPLTDYRVYYASDDPDDLMTVTGHFEQMRRSACYQKSNDLSCLTCHDLHPRVKPKDLTAHYRQKCLNCHASRGCSLGPDERRKKNDDCSACHMPRGNTDVPHVAFTHHRIGHHSTENRGGQRKPVPNLIPLDDAPELPAIDRERNLGLAYLMASARSADRERSAAYHAQAKKLLDGVHEAGLRDGPTLAALASLSRREQNALRAQYFAQAALAAADLPIESRADLLILLAEAHLSEGRPAEALPLLQELTRLRRSSEDWRVLGMLHLRVEQPKEALTAFGKALSIYPFDRQTAAGLADAHGRLGDAARAREFAQKARHLADAPRP